MKDQITEAAREAAKLHRNEFGAALGDGWESWVATAFEHDSANANWPDGSFDAYEKAFLEAR